MLSSGTGRDGIVCLRVWYMATIRMMLESRLKSEPIAKTEQQWLSMVF